MRREKRNQTASHNVRVKNATSRNVRTLREMSPRRIMTLTYIYIAVTPLYKDGDKADIKNYRPISITSLVGKTLERIIRKQVSACLDNAGVIPANQHGFRTRRSCVALLTGTLESWATTLDERAGAHVHAAFLDWQKALDRVPHARLHSKCDFYGIKGPLLRWLDGHSLYDTAAPSRALRRFAQASYRSASSDPCF
jgi:hypothetical protein